MCRIAGIFSREMPIDTMNRMVLNMCELQKHGGPDDAGIYSAETGNLVLGNRRLALLDLSEAGHQPMQYESRYHITYNGEVYNFRELKETLKELGHQFHTNTDTEVVAATYSRWGAQGFARLKGMFALAIWDSIEKELVLARDAAGMKPLYYTRENNGLAFASELRALRILPEMDKANENWQVYLMAYGHVPEPVTTLEKVFPLPKGCFLKYNTGTCTYTIQNFKHYSFSNVIRDEITAIAAIRQQMKSAVERHLLADAPIGIFLSGGVDSGILTMLAAKHTKEKLNSLSIYFEEERYSEKKFQDILIDKAGCNNRQFLLKESEFHQCLPGILDDMDMPCCDGINTWFISKYARQQGLKAVISGIGGDELFGGYPSFNRMKLSSFLHKLPAFMINIGRRSNTKQLNRLSYLNMDGIKGIYLFLRGHFTPLEIARQLDASEDDIWDLLNNVPVFQDLPNLPLKEQASWMEFNIYMQNQLLRDADVMGMANSVEIRVPFLDDDLLKLVMSVSSKVKYEGNGPKPLLVNAYMDELPQAIWKRPKMGFSFPFTEWLNKSEYVKEMMEAGSANTKQNYQRFKEGDLHWSHLMALIHLNKKKHA